MGLGTVLALAVAPFAAADEAVSVCRLTSADSGAVAIRLEPTARNTGADMVMLLGGVRLDAVVRRNTATEAQDLLITAADREGMRVILALHRSGAALLVRERAGGAPAERATGRCAGGTALQRWFPG